MKANSRFTRLPWPAAWCSTSPAEQPGSRPQPAHRAGPGAPTPQHMTITQRPFCVIMAVAQVLTGPGLCDALQGTPMQHERHSPARHDNRCHNTEKRDPAINSQAQSSTCASRKQSHTLQTPVATFPRPPTNLCCLLNCARQSGCWSEDLLDLLPAAPLRGPRARCHCCCCLCARFGGRKGARGCTLLPRRPPLLLAPAPLPRVCCCCCCHCCCCRMAVAAAASCRCLRYQHLLSEGRKLLLLPCQAGLADRPAAPAGTAPAPAG